jgi:hypothetical protein
MGGGSSATASHTDEEGKERSASEIKFATLTKLIVYLTSPRVHGELRVQLQLRLRLSITICDHNFYFPLLFIHCLMRKLINKFLSIYERTDHVDSDLEFLKTFMLTYENFTTSETLFKLLIRRFVASTTFSSA